MRVNEGLVRANDVTSLFARMFTLTTFTSDHFRNLFLFSHFTTVQKAYEWERPFFFSTPNDGVDELHQPDVKTVGEVVWSFDQRNATWVRHARTEAQHIRNGVAVADFSSFARVRVAGADAMAMLDALSTRRLDGESEGPPVRSLVYTLMLTSGGGIEFEGTVHKESSDSFVVMGGSATGEQVRFLRALCMPSCLSKSFLEKKPNTDVHTHIHTLYLRVGDRAHSPARACAFAKLHGHDGDGRHGHFDAARSADAFTAGKSGSRH
jgi:hypothetical protein